MVADPSQLPSEIISPLAKDTILDEIMDADFDKAQPLIAGHLEQLGTNSQDSMTRVFLEALWKYLEALRLCREEADFPRTVEAATLAACQLDDLGFSDLASMSRGLSTYFEAIGEIRRLNISRGIELFKETEDYLKGAGRYGRKYQLLIDHMKPEALLISGMQALQAQDMSAARPLFEQASAGSSRVAQKYYEIGTVQHFTFLGLAEFYRSIFRYYQADRNLSSLELDQLAAETDISAVAKEAERLLSNGDLENTNIRTAYHISRALVELLEAVQEIGARMSLCFKATFKPDLQGFADLRAKTHRAINHASKAGTDAAPFVRACETLLVRINNLQRLAQPQRADFGIYSGMISSLLFVPLIVVASWANKDFGTHLPGAMLFSTVVGLSLIGGFGFGALRFKSFFRFAPRSGHSHSQ
jgi:hypothetical protein